MNRKDISNGYSVTKEGLSFIIPDDKENKNYYNILINTAGSESPLLMENQDNQGNLNLDVINKMADKQIINYFLQTFILEKVIFLFVL